jgi:hypothetical protein
VNVYGHHGYTFTEIIKGQERRELSSRCSASVAVIYISMDANASVFHLNGRDGHARWRKPMLQRIPEWLTTGVAALFLATGSAHTII